MPFKAQKSVNNFQAIVYIFLLKSTAWLIPLHLLHCPLHIQCGILVSYDVPGTF